MSQAFELEAEVRKERGTGASRRLRRLASKVPAIVYGAEKEPLSISIPLKDLVKQLENEAFYSHILNLNVEGTLEKVVLKDLQRHPAKGYPLHADFQRIDDTHKITMHIPIHFLNEEKCVGVKLEGGVISHQMNSVEVSCLAKDLPEYLELDVAELKVGQAFHLSDIQLPAGTTIPALQQGTDHDLTVVNVAKVRGSSADSEDSSAGETESE